MSIFPGDDFLWVNHAAHKKGQQGGTACGCLMGGLRRLKCSDIALRLAHQGQQSFA
jgi:hypothetical protein